MARMRDGDPLASTRLCPQLLFLYPSHQVLGSVDLCPNAEGLADQIHLGCRGHRSVDGDAY